MKRAVEPDLNPWRISEVEALATPSPHPLVASDLGDPLQGGTIQ